MVPPGRQQRDAGLSYRQAFYGCPAAGGTDARSLGEQVRAVESAKDQGLLTAKQVDQILGAAIGEIKGESKPPPDTPFQWVQNEADCAEMVAKLKQGAGGDQ